MFNLFKKAMVLLTTILMVITFMPTLSFADTALVSASIKDKNGSSGFISYSNYVDATDSEYNEDDEQLIKYDPNVEKYYLDINSSLMLDQLAKLCSAINKADSTMAKSITITGSYKLVFNFDKDVKLDKGLTTQKKLQEAFTEYASNILQSYFKLTSSKVDTTNNTVTADITVNSGVTCADFAKVYDDDYDDMEICLEFPEKSVYIPKENFKDGKTINVMTTSYSGNIGLSTPAKYRANATLIKTFNQYKFKDDKGLALTAFDNGSIAFSSSSDADSSVTMTNDSSDEDDVVQVSVRINWEGNKEEIPSEVKVQLYRDGKAFGDPVTITAKDSWKYCWKDLDDNYDWTCKQVRVPTSFEETWKSYDDEDFSDNLNMTHYGFDITNTFTEKGAVGTVGLSVEKFWRDSIYLNEQNGTTDDEDAEVDADTDDEDADTKDDGDVDFAVRPDSIKIQLYKDGEAFGDPVILNKENNWSHYFSGLDQDSKWTCDEVDVPEGYYKNASIDGTYTTITNTDKSFSLYNNTGSPANSTISTKKKTVTTKPFKSPDTGDKKQLSLWIIISVVTIILLIITLKMLKRKK